MTYVSKSLIMVKHVIITENIALEILTSHISVPYVVIYTQHHEEKHRAKVRYETTQVKIFLQPLLYQILSEKH